MPIVWKMEKTIEEAMAVGEYKEGPNDFTSGRRDFSDYHLNSGVWQMYANREMRFYACVGFNGCYWPASSTTDGSYRPANRERLYGRQRRQICRNSG